MLASASELEYTREHNMQTVVGYSEHKHICGMVDVRMYVQRNCLTVHTSVGLAQAHPNNNRLSQNKYSTSLLGDGDTNY